MSQPRRDSIPSLTTDDVILTEVVEYARAGDSSAFDTLFHFYNARICAYLARMVGNDEEGRDLAQETFLKAWRTLSGLQDAARFGPWLYRIATNLAIDHLRRRRFRWPLWKDAEKYGMRMEGPEEQVAQGEQIKQALARLSPMYRACLLLQIDAGFSQREIAELMSIKEKNVSVYVRRGCEQFRQAYQRLEHGRDGTTNKRRKETR